MITVKLEEAEYLEANMLATRWTIKRWLFIGGQSAMFLVIGLYLMYGSGVPPGFHFVGLLLIFWIVLMWSVGLTAQALLVPYRLGRRFRERKALQRSSTLSWDAKGLTVENVNGHMLIPWSDFLKWRQNENFLLLYPTRLTCTPIPKRAFTQPDQLPGLLKLIEQNMGAAEK